MHAMRAKLRIVSVTKTLHGETLKMEAVSKTTAYPADGSDEDNTFAKFTPSASLEMAISNPALNGKFAPGNKFYVYFTPCTETV